MRGHALVALVVGVRDHNRHSDLVDAGRDGSVIAALVKHETDVGHIFTLWQQFHQRLGIGHLWHALGVYETRHLDPPHARIDGPRDERGLLFGGQDFGFGLQAVAGTDLNDLNVGAV